MAVNWCTWTNPTNQMSNTTTVAGDIFYHKRNMYEVKIESVDPPNWPSACARVHYRRTADCTNGNFTKLVGTKQYVFLSNFRKADSE